MGNALPLGTIIESYDDYWGWGEFLLCQYQTASTAVPTGTVVVWDNNYIISASPATANTGRPVGILSTNFLSDSTLGALTYPWNQVQTTNQLYGWVCIGGLCPVLAASALTAGALNQSATAGQAQTAHIAGQQILNAYTVVPTATAWSRFGSATLPGNTIVGRSEIFVNDKTGLFPGINLNASPVNFPANSAVTDMQTGRNNSFLVSSGNAATLSGPCTITPSYTGGGSTFGLAMVSRPFIQGAIT